MEQLGPPDGHHLNAAQGWLALGAAAEAQQEMNQIHESLQKQPAVLETQWQIFVAQGDWDAAFITAESCVRLHPEVVTGWIHLAFAVRRMAGGGLESAFERLRPAADRFPSEPVIPFNLACYATQMNRLEDGWNWLLVAVHRADAKSIKVMAMADPDLEPLRSRISTLG
jgi:predicted Zn-dependent protease